ncbi:glutaredoxin family protein [Georgenia muralis]
MGATVVVYSQGGCQACRLTLSALERAGVAYELVDLEENAAARELLLAMEFQTVPVVTTGEQWWAGFRPDRIRTLTRA